jgi:predicted nucleotidyltransferase
LDPNYLVYRVKDSILSITPKADIYLFGSRARGDFQKESDWDLLILTQSSVTSTLRNDIITQLFYIELETEQAISAIIHQINEWNENYKITPLYENIKKEGILL